MFESRMPTETHNKPKYHCFGLRFGESVCIGVSYTSKKTPAQNPEALPKYAPNEDKKSSKDAKMEAGTYMNS